MVEDNMKIRYHCACLHYNRSVPVVTITGLRSMRPDVLFLAVARVMSPLCVVVAMILVSQLLCSASMAADNNIGPTHLKDYVACQFTSAEESQWKDQENSAFIRSRHAAVSELQKAPQQKEVKQALKAAEKATNDVSLTVAIDAISDINVRDAVQQSRRDAQMQVPQEFKTPDDLLCSRSLLGWQEAADIFGRRIANTYLVIQVVVRNLNPDSDYLIQDVIVAAPNTRFGSGRDKLLARGVAITGQSRDPRNMIMNGLDTLAATSSAIALIGTQGAMLSSSFMNFQNANNVLTAFLPPLKRWFPDFTVDQLNRLNDLTFSASTTYKMLVPKGSSTPFVTFVSQQLFPDPVHKWKPEEFVANDMDTFVLVAGAHIQEVPGPSIGQLSPPNGAQGAAVTINGTNFGTTQGSGGVKFGSATATISSWSPSAIIAAVPIIPTGPTAVVVSAGGKDSAPATFTVNCPPTVPCITYLSPPLGAPGTVVTITGANFGPTPGVVKFGSATAAVVAAANWTPTTIKETVPNIAPGPVNVVITAGGTDSPPAIFAVNCPSVGPCITALSATSAAAGTSLTISGLNFGLMGSVKFGSTAAAVAAGAWTPTRITINVPAGLTAGQENDVIVTIGGVASPPSPFIAL